MQTYLIQLRGKKYLVTSILYVTISPLCQDSSLWRCQTTTGRTLLRGGACAGCQLAAFAYLFREQGDEVSLELGLYHLHHVLHLCWFTAIDKFI